MMVNPVQLTQLVKEKVARAHLKCQRKLAVAATWRPPHFRGTAAVSQTSRSNAPCNRGFRMFKRPCLFTLLRLAFTTVALHGRTAAVSAGPAAAMLQRPLGLNVQAPSLPMADAPKSPSS